MEQYKDLATRKSDLERTELQKEKTGVFSGCYARNPANGEAIPIWVADYVLGRCVVCTLYIPFFIALCLLADACMLELQLWLVFFFYCEVDPLIT